MRLEDDDFTLLGLKPHYQQERAELDQRWRAIQAQVHPDRFAAQGASAQRVAMQWAVRINEAYRRLRDPLQRAAYLCEQRGAPIDAERNTAMPADFLMQQMGWREALDEAADEPTLTGLAEDVAQARQTVLDRIAHLLDEAGDAQGAAQQVRALMFIERFEQDIERRLEALGQ